LYHFAILLPDRAALGRFVSHLAAVGVAAGSADHAVSEAIYLTDPDGLGIEVYADRPRASWRRAASGELFMTTAPLALDSLVEAGRGEPWTGMPSGTVMGHVHLHVGDLDRAARFYQAGIGFDSTVWSYPGARFFSAGGYHHHLGINTWSSGAPADEGHARLLSWTLVVPHAADVAGSAAAAGFAARQESDDVWTAADPWGTALRIVSDTRGSHS
jgi:catechol 2,3-dioxygenase